jgi:hypothetical protein
MMDLVYTYKISPSRLVRAAEAHFSRVQRDIQMLGRSFLNISARAFVFASICSGVRL